MKGFSWSKFNSLVWYDTFISFIFRFMAKTSEPLLAVGIIVSAIDFLQKGQLLAAHPQLAFALSCTKHKRFSEAVQHVSLSLHDNEHLSQIQEIMTRFTRMEEATHQHLQLFSEGVTAIQVKIEEHTQELINLRSERAKLLPID